MKWFRILLVAAVICATLAIGTWGFYALMGVEIDDESATFALIASMLALVLGGSSLVSRVAQHS